MPHNQRDKRQQFEENRRMIRPTVCSTGINLSSCVDGRLSWALTDVDFFDDPDDDTEIAGASVETIVDADTMAGADVADFKLAPVEDFKLGTTVGAWDDSMPGIAFETIVGTVVALILTGDEDFMLGALVGEDFVL
jgi:hypothetical protein